MNTPPPQTSSPTAAHPPKVVDVASYVKHHRIHVLLDRLVKDLLLEKPADSAAWMLRWFVERHRLACEERHLRLSPQRNAVGSLSPAAHSGDAIGGEGLVVAAHTHNINDVREDGDMEPLSPEDLSALEEALFTHGSFEGHAIGFEDANADEGGTMGDARLSSIGHHEGASGTTNNRVLGSEVGPPSPRTVLLGVSSKRRSSTSVSRPTPPFDLGVSPHKPHSRRDSNVSGDGCDGDGGGNASLLQGKGDVLKHYLSTASM